MDSEGNSPDGSRLQPTPEGEPSRKPFAIYYGQLS